MTQGAEGFARAWEAALDMGMARLEDCALSLALEGEEVPIVSAAIPGWRRKRNAGLIQFLLRQRRSDRFAAGLRRANDQGGEMKPGHPLYDGLRAQWEAQFKAAREARRPAWVREFTPSRSTCASSSTMTGRASRMKRGGWFRRRRRASNIFLALPNLRDRQSA